MPSPAQADIRCSTVCTLALPDRDGGGQARVGHGLGADRNVHRLGQVHATKDDARVGLRRAQGQLDPLAAVHPDANGAGQVS